MSLGLRYAARSDVGLLRDGNEDSMYAGPRLLAVADGMGGHAAGEVASRVVIETVAALDAQPPADGALTEALRQAVETANGYLRDMVAADSALEGMGTTLTALLWVGQQLGMVHVGDSRAYLLRDGELELITHDHTLVQNLIDDGRITEDEASTHPQRSWITRALDGRPAVELDLSMRDARAGDRYLICSDGLSSYVTEDTIAEALRLPDVQAACDRLVDLALRAGGPDNVTCIVADLVEESEGDGAPIVGGAAAGADGADPSRTSTPASRAAAVARPAATGPATTDAPPPPVDTADLADDTDDEEGEEDDLDRPGSGSSASRRVALLLGAVVLLVVLGVIGTFLYIRTQYYVGVADGSPSTVAVYRGVTGSILGIDLSRVAQRSDLPVADLPDYQQPRVTSGIQASSEADAQRIVTTLRQQTCDAATQAAQAAQRAARQQGDKHPTRPPLPSYCQAGS